MAVTVGLLLTAVLCLYAADLTEWLCQIFPPPCEAHRPIAVQRSVSDIGRAIRAMLAEGHLVPHGLALSFPALTVLAIARSLILRGTVLALFFAYPAAPVLSYSRFYSCNHGTCEDALGIYVIGQNALYSLGAVLSLAYIGYRAYRQSAQRRDR